MQNNDNERVRPKLASADELHRHKSRDTGKSAPGKKRVAILIALLIAIGAVVGGYLFVLSKKPPEEEKPASTYQDTTIQLVEGHVKNDLAKLTPYWNGEEQYTIVSNLAEKAEAQAALDALKAEQADAEPVADLTTVTEMAIAPVVIDKTVEYEAILAKPDFEVEGMPWFELQTTHASNMATYSYTLIASRIIEENSADLSAYGLADPQLKIVYTYHDGTTMTVNVGNKVVAGNYYYVTIGDSRDVYMAYQNIYTYNTKQLVTMHTMPTLPTFDTENVITQHLYIAQRGKDTIECDYLSNSEDKVSIGLFRMLQPINYETNSDRIAEIEADIAAVTLKGYAGYILTEEDRAAYGLADPYAVIGMTDVNGQSVTFTVGDYVADSDSLRYVTIDDTGRVYTLDVSLISFLSNCRVTYLVDQFANLVYIKRINGFDLSTPETTYVSTIERQPYTDEDGTEKTHDTYYFDGQYADEDIFKDFYQVVIGTLFDKRIENEDEYQFDGDVVCSVTYHLTYTDEPYVIEYLDYDRDYCAIRREGYTFFLIRKEKIQNMLDIAEAYRKGEYDGAHDTYSY